MSVREFLKAIAVHEMFHHYVERFINDAKAYLGHPCSPWCDLEEAGANYVAFASASKDPASLATFKDIIFKQKGPSGGLHGYGEYHLLDDRIVDALAVLKRGTKGGCVAPADFGSALLDPAIHAACFGGSGRAFFEAILASANDGSIPFYYDMVN